MSVVPAIDGIAQLHVEFPGSPKLSMAAIIGTGSVVAYQSSFSGHEPGPFPMFLAGVQANYYLVGDFEHGM